MRIVRWQYKLLYVVVGFLVATLVIGLLPIQGTGLPIAGFVLDLALFIVGARIFRGRSEDIRAPRAWWRMTSKWRLSYRLGFLFSILFVVTIVAAILFALHTSLGKHSTVSDTTALFASAALYAVLAFFYLNCAARLSRVTQLGLILPLQPRRRNN